MFSKSLSAVSIKTREIALIFVFALALALSAQIKIPLFFTPVPLTLQTFVVYLAIRTLKKKAFLPVLLYTIAGVLGFPVFAASSFGLIYLAGPTGGYIVGFLLTALIIPFIFTGKPNFLLNIFSFFAASLVIYGLGIAWLVFLYNLSLPAALVAGFYPFVAGEALKIIATAFLTKQKA